MNLSTLFRTKENLNLDKNTLTFLRYIAIFGQFLAINIVFFYLGLPFPIQLSYIVIFIGLLTNLYLQFGIRINQLKDFYAAIFLVFDLIQIQNGKSLECALKKSFNLTLPELEGAASGISDAYFFVEKNLIVATAAVEQTLNTYDDGAVLGSFILVLSPEGKI